MGVGLDLLRDEAAHHLAKGLVLAAVEWAPHSFRSVIPGAGTTMSGNLGPNLRRVAAAGQRPLCAHPLFFPCFQRDACVLVIPSAYSQINRRSQPRPSRRDGVPVSLSTADAGILLDPGVSGDSAGDPDPASCPPLCLY